MPILISAMARELLDNPGRRLLAANSLRFRSPQFAVELVETAQRLRGTEPARAQDCAELAVLIARHFGGDLLVRALAEYGNILRIRGFYRRARLVLSEALSHHNCSTAARLDTLSYQASLEEHLRDFPSAERFLSAGLRLAKQGQDRARFMIKRGINCLYIGRPVASTRLLRSTFEVMPDNQPHLNLSALQAYATALSDAGQPEAAQEILDRCSNLYQFATATDIAKLRWVEGKISLATQSYQAALRAFQDALQRFRDLRLTNNMAFLNLEVAIVLVHLGRCPEAVEIAKESQASLELLGMSPDAMVAQLLRSAIEAPSARQLATAARALVLSPPRDAEDT